MKATKNYDSYWDGLETEVNSFFEKMRGLKLEQVSDQQLLAEVDELFHIAKKVNDLRFYFIADSSLLSVLTLSTIIKMFTRKIDRPVISDLITTNLNYKTSVIDKKLVKLAVLVSESKEIKSFILSGNYQDEHQFQQILLNIPGGANVWDEIEKFLNKYGYRTEKMYQPFISKSWLDDKMYFLDIFKAVLNDRQLLDRKRKEQERKEKHEQWVHDFEKKLKGPFKVLFKSSYKNLRKIYIYREETVFFIEELFHYGRKLVNELGVRLEKVGVLEEQKDMVYLLREELADIALKKADSDTVQRLIRKRKGNLEKNQRMWKQNIVKLSSTLSNHENIITGVSGSNGLVEGPVRIITKIEDFKKLKQGDILVCQYTDPAWTPLFGIAAAVVADTGGPLSHAAIVAREYEIPAVLGTKVGSTTLTDGEVIVVDGTSGKVIRE